MTKIPISALMLFSVLITLSGCGDEKNRPKSEATAEVRNESSTPPDDYVDVTYHTVGNC